MEPTRANQKWMTQENQNVGDCLTPGQVASRLCNTTTEVVTPRAWTLSQDFFPPIEIPTIPHKPWAQHNIPIPPGIYDEVCRLMKLKLDVGVYKPLNSSYHL